MKFNVKSCVVIYSLAIIRWCSCESVGEVGDDVVAAGNSKVQQQPSYRLIDIRMPGVRTTEEDEYLCFGWRVPDEELYIMKFEALADASTVHHILLFGCPQADISTYRRGCYAACSNGSDSIMYAWAQNAPSLDLPKDVGFHIGKGSAMQYVVMQVHYRMPMDATDADDHSGLRLTISPVRQPFIGGILLMVDNFLTIPAHSEGVHGDTSCQYMGDAVIHPFAFRTHAHVLGRVLAGYHVNDSWHEMAKGNPQWPQAFYPIMNNIEIKKGDYLVSRCTFDAKNKSVETHIGATHNDEMCNLYIMYYTPNGERSYYLCMGNNVPDLVRSMPLDSDTALPPNSVLYDIAVGHIHRGIEVMTSWPEIQTSDNLRLGQVSGVAIDVAGHVHVFHRGSRTWDGSSFGNDNKFRQVTDGPIHEKTLVEFDPVSGRVIKQWGADIFYMPHGLTIDDDNNFWVTDVALHQVMKFPVANGNASLILGSRFEPGSDSQHFCKPADVAVLNSGEFFVADGYCNSRIMKFSKGGQFLMHWGTSRSTSNGPPPPGTFSVPHSVAIDEERHLVCVADRENGRVQCFDLDGRFIRLFQRVELSPATYAIEFCKSNGYMYAVNGMDYNTDPNTAILGSVIDPTSGDLISTWQPKRIGFSQPHDVAVSSDGRYIYVAEIGPNNVWQFINYINMSTAHQSVKKGGANNVHLSIDSSTDESPGDIVANSVQQPSVTIITLALVGLIVLPITVTVIVTACLWQSKRGYHVQRNMHSVDFKPLVTKSKAYRDTPDSEDSDVEEFSVMQGTPLNRLDNK
jgi:peptidylamidoglycolate lyase